MSKDEKMEAALSELSQYDAYMFKKFVDILDNKKGNK